jgi:hypothetical protein
VDMTAAVVAFAGFVIGTVLGGRFARHLDYQTRLWADRGTGHRGAGLVDPVGPGRRRRARLSR